MLNTIKIVRFNDGRYGLRKGLFPFGYVYYIFDEDDWICRFYCHFNNRCKLESLDLVRVYLNNLTDLGEPIE